MPAITLFSPTPRALKLASLAAIGLVVSACGGGGSSSSTPVVVTSSTAVSSASAISSSSSAPSSSSAASSSSTGVYSANVDSLKSLATTFPIGIAVSNTDSPSYNILTNTAEKTVAEKHFNQMTAGNIMKVSYLHPSLNNFTFTNADAFIDYAKTKDINVHGHALIWHSDYQVPSFIKNWSGSSADFLAMLDTHVTTIVDHFETKDNLVSWDVVNEAIADTGGFRTDSAFYTKSGDSAVYIERSFKAARLADNDVDLYYNDYNIEQNNAKTDTLITMLTDFQARSIPITGVGFQMHVFLSSPSITSIKAAMQRVVDKGLKVKITELDVSINNPYSANWPSNKVNPVTQAALLSQKKRYCDIVKAYIETVPVAQRGGITVWGASDSNTWLNDLYKTQFSNEKISWPLLFDDQYNDKPALRGFADGLLGSACTNL